jgi:hypothetical protein
MIFMKVGEEAAKPLPLRHFEQLLRGAHGGILVFGAPKQTPEK